MSDDLATGTTDGVHDIARSAGAEDVEAGVNELDDDAEDNGNNIDDGFDDDDAADDAGNRVSGGTPLAVVHYLLNAIAAEPEAIVVNTEERGGALRFRIHVAPEDMGRVIGRRGRVAQAIRTLVAAAGARDGVQTSVDIVDD